MLSSSLLWLSLFLSLVFCNTEKVVFTAPGTIRLPTDASVDNLLLTSLNPTHLSVRTQVNATFPTKSSPKGTASWLLLEGLNPGQRYEVRICWLATQPTSFWMYTHSMSQAFETPSLLSSLSSYAYSRHASLSQEQIVALRNRRPISNTQPTSSSILFLQIHAAADYYSLNKELMIHVPPVLVDIILDPYLLNIFPRSLVPTAIYLVAVAIGAWFLAKYISMRLHKLSTAGQTPTSSGTKGVEAKKLE